MDEKHMGKGLKIVVLGLVPMVSIAASDAGLRDLVFIGASAACCIGMVVILFGGIPEDIKRFREQWAGIGVTKQMAGLLASGDSERDALESLAQTVPWPHKRRIAKFLAQNPRRSPTDQAKSDSPPDMDAR